MSVREKTLIYNALRDAVLKLEDTAQENRVAGNTMAANVSLGLAAEFGQLASSAQTNLMSNFI